ncbi:MAG: peptidoglycan-associated lipoprotein Pal [Gammaproteobacteria bacterium]
MKHILIKSTVAVVALSVGLFLTGCNTTKGGGANGMGGAGYNGAQAQGMGSETSFGPNSSNRLKAPFNQTYYFDFDRSDVFPDDYASIQVQAKYLVAHPNAKVQLQGNTDDRGSREYNIALGWRRAKAVQAILEQNGVAPNQINCLSFGAEKPVAVGDNESAWRLNRRVDLVYKSY